MRCRPPPPCSSRASAGLSTPGSSSIILAFAVSLPGLAQRLRKLAAFVVGGTSNTTTPQGIIALVETLTYGLLEDALDAFEPAVAAVEGGIVVRAQQRAFAALVMRAVGEHTPLSDGEAEKVGARLLKQAAKVRSSVAKAVISGEHERIDILRRAPYPAPGAPPLPWETTAPSALAPAPAPVPAPASAPPPKLPQPPAVERPSRIKFSLQWARALGADGCARVEKVFDDDDSDSLAEFTDKDGELATPGLRLVVSSLAHAARAQDAELQAAHDARLHDARVADALCASSVAAARADAARSATEAERAIAHELQESQRATIERLREQLRTAEDREYACVRAVFDEELLAGDRARKRVIELEEKLWRTQQALDAAEARLEGRAIGAHGLDMCDR